MKPYLNNRKLWVGLIVWIGLQSLNLYAQDIVVDTLTIRGEELYLKADQFQVEPGGLVRVSWEEPPETDIEFYTVFFINESREVKHYQPVNEVDQNGTWSFLKQVELEVGTWYVFLTATDTSGNQSPKSVGVTLQVEDETPARRAGFMLEIVRKGRTP